jgi:hypothetical protein
MEHQYGNKSDAAPEVARRQVLPGEADLGLDAAASKQTEQSSK